MKDETRKTLLITREDVLTYLRPKTADRDDEDEAFALLPTDPDCTFLGIIRWMFKKEA